jgi:hypothetical protein
MASEKEKEIARIKEAMQREKEEEMGGSVIQDKKLSDQAKHVTKSGFKKGGKLSFKEILKKRRMRY